MPGQLTRVPGAAEDGFFRANMIPTVIDDDRAAADAVNRRTMSGYVTLPNYRNYWREAGYAEEMATIEAALAAGERDRLPELMPDRWLHDVTLGGSVARGARRARGVGRSRRPADRRDVVDLWRSGQGDRRAVRGVRLSRHADAGGVTAVVGRTGPDDSARHSAG